MPKNDSIRTSTAQPMWAAQLHEHSGGMPLPLDIVIELATLDVLDARAANSGPVGVEDLTKVIGHVNRCIDAENALLPEDAPDHDHLPHLISPAFWQVAMCLTRSYGDGLARMDEAALRTLARTLWAGMTLEEFEEVKAVIVEEFGTDVDFHVPVSGCM